MTTKLTFHKFLSESLNDKGIFKAIFVIGIPGAGKSYTVSKLGGAIGPRIVNTDRAAEFIGKKIDRQVTEANWDALFKDSAHRITKAALYNYLNGMLPLFIDGTSNDTFSILQRIKILESLGYDVGMVFIDTPLETARARIAERAKGIGRDVSDKFLNYVHEQAAGNRAFFKTEIPFYLEIKNGEGELGNEAMQRAFKKVSTFFTSPLQNLIGNRTVEALRATGEKYLVPGYLSEAALKGKLDLWYRS